MLMLLFLGTGTIAALLLPVQSVPDFDPRVVQITVPYPGATPEEVEEGVTRRVEERVRDVVGVRRVRSVAQEGVGTVMADLATFAEPRSTGRHPKAVDACRIPGGLPSAPVERARARTSHVASLGAASEDGFARAAKSCVTLLAANGARVDIFGARDYEISIEVSEQALLRNDLTVEEVAMALRRASVNRTSGELRTDAGGVLIRTTAKAQEADSFADIAVLTRPDGSMLRLGDVATIDDGFAENALISRIDGRPAVFLRVRESDAGEPQVISAAEAVMAAAAEVELPDGIDVVSWEDGSERIRIRVGRMVANAVLGITLVFAFLILVFDLRFAVWIAAGIPIAFMGGVLLFEPLGLTINTMTLLALVLATGIVVDDAIVVGESIAVQHESGNTGVAGAIAGARAVVGPVVTGVATTMVAFAILAFMPGSMGQLVSAVPYVVIAVLAVSLLEAFVILPAHLAHGRPWSRAPLADVQAGVQRWLRSCAISRGEAIRRTCTVADIGAASHLTWRLVCYHVLVRFVLYAAGDVTLSVQLVPIGRRSV